MKKIFLVLILMTLILLPTKNVFADEKDIDYTQKDVKLLTCLIKTEAGNQSKKGKLAVGNVVLNRVKSDKFPDTIKKVIYQKKQFSVISNGSFSEALEDYKDMDKQTKECLKTAKAVLNGEKVINSNVLYFTVSSSDFNNKLSGYEIIGDHVFFSKWPSN